MPERENLFSQAENHRYNVSNVLSDAAYKKTEPANATERDEPEINLEEGAPFLDGIDPNATIGDYMQLNEEEFLEENEIASQSEEVIAAPLEEDDAQPGESLQNPAIREQAEKARASFMDDLDALSNEPAIKKMDAAKEAPEKFASTDDMPVDEEMGDMENTVAPSQEQNEHTFYDEEDDDDGPEALTFKDLLKPAARRIKKPRFAKKDHSEEVTPEQDENTVTDVEDEYVDTSDSDAIMQERTPETEDNEDELSQELAEARAAQRRGQSICDDLYHLQTLLEEGRSPFMHKTEVLVPREKTLRLIRSLTAICEVDPSYIDSASEDKLIDRLVSEHSEDDYKPLERARSRAQAILKDATRQADTIIGDAKTLARQLLAETEAEIREKFDAADEQIAVRMSTTKEESTKKLNQARSELTTSRQRSVEILSKYLEKAESDYQGYWERAENTVMASLEQSESILGKAADIYRKELLAIHQDKQEINEILEHMKKYKKRSKR